MNIPQHYSKSFSIKALIISILLCFLSSIHIFLNVFSKYSQRHTILYLSDVVPADVYSVITVPGDTLVKHNVHHVTSFLHRKNSVNTIIHTPFAGFAITQQQLFEKYYTWILANYNTFLSKSNYTHIFVYDEPSLPVYALIKSAHQNNITTIAIQHGLMDQKEPGRAFLKYTNDSEFIPSYTLVNSPFEKRTLLADTQNYTEKNVRIVGCPRYDDLYKQYTSVNIAQLKKKYNIPENKKVALWMTQTHSVKISQEESIRTRDAMFSAFSQLSDYQLIIKLHPNENQRAPLYYQGNKKFSIDTYIMNRTSNLVELLLLADVAFLKNSTTGNEAIMVNVPIILLEIKKSSDLSIYTDAGFDLVARSQQDIEKLLSLVETKQYQKKFSRIRKKYLEDTLSYYGTASEKMNKEVKRILK